MYSAEKESTFPDSKTEEEKRNYAGIKDGFALILSTCALHMCFFTTLTAENGRNDHIETRLKFMR